MSYRLAVVVVMLMTIMSASAADLVLDSTAQKIIQNGDIITISSSKDFSEFYGMLCDGTTFAGCTIVLNSDISFDTGGKTGSRNFEGKLDGQGHKLEDVNSSLLTNNRGEIRNLHISSGTLKGSGIFCVTNYGNIINCKNSANISNSSSSSEGISAAAICTSNYGNIINCVNEGKVELELIAIYGSWSKGTSSCGGICSYSGNGSSIVNCTNTGNINNSGIYFSITGGIVATSEHALIVGCKNYGLIYSFILNSSPSKGNVTTQSYQHQHVGGIAGHVLNCVINRCSNHGNVKSNFQYLGGIAGYVGNSDVYNLENFGDIDGYEGYGFHSVSGIIPYFKNPDKRQYFLNCINHGNITAFAKYGVATGAGISAEIENAYIANCYSNASISSTHTGNMSAGFQISQYECENCEELNAGINNPTDANAFIGSYDGPETLLKWSDESTLCGDYFSYPIAQHGNCNIYVYPEIQENKYMLKVWENNSISQPFISVTSYSPVEVRGLTPDTDYYFEVLSEDSTQLLDNGKFNTLSPNISFNTSSIGYDNIEFNYSCDAKGVDDIEINLLFGKSNQAQEKIEVMDSIITLNDLDEETNYSAELVYSINGKEYTSDKINASTKAIIPQFSLISRTPYSLTIKCDNYEELKKYSPVLYIKNPKLYDFGGFKEGESRCYEFDNDYLVTIDSLLYDYKPSLYGKYTINGEERLRKGEVFSTLSWGGEGIIQLSPNAAMVHGLFGGMGERVPNGGYNDKYDRARFYYRDATDLDYYSDSYVESVSIDNGVDYATTIPLKNNLYQYYISLQYSHFTDPKNKAKEGDWQIIDNRYPTVDIVKPRFFNVNYDNQVINFSCVQGEEQISCKFLMYKVEGVSNFNVITLSTKNSSETLSKTLSTIVPQLSYIVRFGCSTNNGKTYYSNYYRLYNNTLEILDDYEENIPISSITINNENLILSIEESEQLIVKISPDNATNKNLLWTSSDENIATVNSEGIVTAVGPGFAIITVTSTDGSGVSATCYVTVRVLVSTIILNESEVTLNEGETVQLSASVTPELVGNDILYWFSSNEDVATVDNNGLVSAIAPGNAIIKVNAIDGSDVSATCYIEVIRPITSISVSEHDIVMRVGEFRILTANITPTDASNSSLSWTSSDDSIASVQNGILLAHKLGNTTIRVCATDGSGIYDECMVKVTDDADVEDVATNSRNYSIESINGSIVINGANENEVSYIFDSGGHLLYRGFNRVIPIPTGIYIVVIGRYHCKVLVL